ncbi:hypothetical protein BDN70DRAFT_882131 [Pholiota conissans]|uniref:Myb/SANT-like domain-containing protein n=1 Tax=Pholiota conissans TaxID=109636 RepID=A0A9P5YWW8_9AGAR|nr:hypothetical protein BDN70DRAFT_882131 [Pholiota conissans]
MAKDTSQAVWTTDDETTLIEFLFQHRASAGDGSSFKMTTFHAAVPVLEAKRAKGGPKTAKSCQNKWSNLRRIWRAIQDIKTQSGWTWSDTRGADISPDMESQWETFLKSHSLARPFKNHGWIHLEKVTMIMPATLRGHHVYLPSQGTVGLAAAAAVAPAASDDVADVSDAADDVDAVLPTSASSSDAVDVPSPHPILTDDSFETLPSTPRLLAKRERCDSLISFTPPLSKKVKTTGRNADRLQGLTDSINNFGDNICKVLAIDPTLRTPHRRKEALKLAQGEKWMSMTNRLIFCRCLEKNIGTADGYLVLDADDQEWRRLWINAVVKEALGLPTL